MNESLLSDTEREEAAVAFVTSSATSSYIAYALRLGGRATFTTRMKSDPELLSVVVARVRALWSDVLRSSERGSAEFELAVVLGGLRTIASTDLDSLLRAIAASAHRMVAWLGPLARTLIAMRPPITVRACAAIEPVPFMRSFRGAPHLNLSAFACAVVAPGQIAFSSVASPPIYSAVPRLDHVDATTEENFGAAA